MRHRTILTILRTLAALLAASSLQAGAVPFLSVDIADRYVGKGQAFSVGIRINDVQDLFAYQFDLTFDPALLSVQGVEEGSFLPGGGPTIFHPGTIDNAGGSVSFVLATLAGDLPGADGTGELARLYFQASGNTGLSTFRMPNIILLDSTLADIAFDPPIEDYVVVVPSPGSLALVLPMLPLLAWVSRRRKEALSACVLSRAPVAGP